MTATLEATDTKANLGKESIFKIMKWVGFSLAILIPNALMWHKLENTMSHVEAYVSQEETYFKNRLEGLKDVAHKFNIAENRIMARVDERNATAQRRLDHIQAHFVRELSKSTGVPLDAVAKALADDVAQREIPETAPDYTKGAFLREQIESSLVRDERGYPMPDGSFTLTSQKPFRSDSSPSKSIAHTDTQQDTEQASKGSTGAYSANTNRNMNSIINYINTMSRDNANERTD